MRSKKIFVQQILGPKKFFVQNFLVQKNFGPNKIMSLKKKFFGLNKSVYQILASYSA